MSILYPHIEPYDKNYLQVSPLHKLYYEQCGNPEGLPVIIIHGGPGSRCGSLFRRFFNPDKYNIVLFDQRGGGRSRPLGELRNNKTQYLVDDIERIRRYLQIKKWFLIFGNSWGCVLTLLYAKKFPNRVQNILLQGVFLGTYKENSDYINGKPASELFPDYYSQFVQVIPPSERGDLYRAYLDKFRQKNKREILPYLKSWEEWEGIIGSLGGFVEGNSGERSVDQRIAFGKIFCHYLSNDCFLEDEEVLDAVKSMNIPCTIIQGRYDMNCPFIHAWNLYNIMPNSRLIKVKSGHSCFEKVNARLIRKIGDEL